MAVDGGYRGASGTSFAAPMVTAAAAMALSVNPELSAGQLKTVLMGTVTDVEETGYDAQTGSGRIDLMQAIMIGRCL